MEAAARFSGEKVRRREYLADIEAIVSAMDGGKTAKAVRNKQQKLVIQDLNFLAVGYSDWSTTENDHLRLAHFDAAVRPRLFCRVQA